MKLAIMLAVTLFTCILCVSGTQVRQMPYHFLFLYGIATQRFSDLGRLASVAIC